MPMGFGLDSKVKSAAETMVINPAAGPLMVMAAPPAIPVRSPPIMAEMIPRAGGNPLALAMPKLKGKAINATRRPAFRSLNLGRPRKVCLRYERWFFNS